jgi:hypothetical protein
VSLHVLDDAGQPLDAHVDLDDGEIVYHSRGGARGGTNARNLDYGRALRLVLERIARSGHRLTGVWVDSDEALRLPRNQREILSGANLIAAPADQFRILSRNMQTFGRAPDAAYGGSRVKKIRLAGDWPADGAAIRAHLGIASDDGSTFPIDDEISALDDVPPFDPTSIEDGRRKIAALVKRRQGQSAFRRTLLRAYNGRCAFTGCDIEPLLEAAHIHPYRGPDTNSVQNGLLLRADVHTLFDLGLITVSPTNAIVVAPGLSGTEYATLAGRALRFPKVLADRPSELALAWHRENHAARA